MTEDRSRATGGGYRAPLTPRHFLPRHWGSWLGLGLLWLLHQLPRPFLRGLVPGLAWLLRRGSAKRRHFATLNLSWCFPALTPEQREHLLREHYRFAAQGMLDYGMLWFGSAATHAARIRVVGHEHYLRLQARQVPVIVLSPHSIALDHGGLRMSQLHNGVSFAKQLRNPVVEWINHRTRTRYSAQIYSREQGLRPAIRQMRQGRNFYYLPDEDLGAEGAVFVDFLGVSKATLTSLGRLARVTGAAVVPSFAWYDRAEDQYVVTLSPALENFPSGDDRADARAMNAAIEKAVRERPAQYLWTMRLFQTRPGGAPNPYRSGSAGPRADAATGPRTPGR
ncbi:Lipid A biosynthesis (KDO) 2-(lauroyl)-lipid IVA acyltransferase [Thioalkalivibrio nitratireducens DSM 14787]|uniref:Lipid A biosynthesis (KDO) 2-(Lauroyl)-lipid IVA acyltransferase n=1 Tax=Thioalkalivibrio nitratireducens (strain DSM 14787 / UNIQEM 213 / ALEN2) TaxID=1255043 RepID=L0DT16_THIND|nr:lipid A biosynthesis (KDO)2-(lauroyl)-lipid IVA acyltransferase [Thioalkalivibrio nitratireducens]AGA32130.1 Lipid A biosynthesis (KDO) 2-(lauroyl)-lipid IVA acyltransferase [Thioalkalivibrio nitratireducens DSM 14787]